MCVGVRVCRCVNVCFIGYTVPQKYKIEVHAPTTHYQIKHGHGFYEQQYILTEQ